MAAENGPHFARANVPQAHIVIRTGRGEYQAVWPEGDSINNAALSFEHGPLAGFRAEQAPQADDAVVRRAGQRAAVGRERHGIHFARVRFE